MPGALMYTRAVLLPPRFTINENLQNLAGIGGLLGIYRRKSKALNYVLRRTQQCELMNINFQIWGDFDADKLRGKRKGYPFPTRLVKFMVGKLLFGYPRTFLIYIWRRVLKFPGTGN